MSVLQESQVHLLQSLQWQLQGSPPSQKPQSSRCRMSMARGRDFPCDMGKSPNGVTTGRETDCPNSFSGVGKSPPGHHRRGFSNDYYGCGTSGPGKSWTGLWRGLLHLGTAGEDVSPAHLETPLCQGKMEDARTD